MGYCPYWTLPLVAAAALSFGAPARAADAEGG